MLCMYNCLYFIANKRLCFDVVLCLCFILNVRTIAERVCRISIIPTPFRSETPLVDAYSFHNLILIFNMIDGNVLVTITDIKVLLMMVCYIWYAFIPYWNMKSINNHHPFWTSTCVTSIGLYTDVLS